MASGPLVGGGGNGNDGSREKHRWADSSKVYTRKSFNKGSKSSLNLNPQPPPASSNQTLASATAGDGANSSLRQPPQPPPSPSAASDDDSSSLSRHPNPANGRRRLVTISLASRSKHEVRDLRRKLTAELEQVRSFVRRFERRENHQAAAFGVTIPIPSQFSASDAALTTPVPAKRASTNSEAASTASLRHQRSMSVVLDSSVGEKDKRMPKANKYHRNSDFVLSKEKFPPADSHSHKKSKSNGSKMVDSKLFSQAFTSCASLLSKLMKHKHGWVFNTPVDVKGLGLHDYYSIIKHPMDLGTVKSRLSKNWYKTPKEFAEDVRVTFNNAMFYNPKGQDVHVMAEQLLQMFEERWPAIEAEYTYLVSPQSPPPPVSAKRPPHIDTKRILERSDSTVYPMSVDSKTKPVSYTAHVGRPPALKKPKAKDLHKRDMTFEEKQKLSNNLQNLPTEKLDNIVQIIKKRNSSLSQHDDEIEVDIDSVDTETLWELDRFVTNYKKSLSKNKRKAELTELAHLSGPDVHHNAVHRKGNKRTDEKPFGGDSDGAPPSKRFAKGDSDEDGIVVCELSKSRRVSVKSWQGKIQLDIREFYMKDGQQLPGKKGISLSMDQWQILREHIDNINEAVAENA